ncbi:hypothetical protein C8R43DRAFT_944831 [Mycena crocata]|nr:hypothetical protein C8R43DRAFT_944831 [Mycena crocata]
MVPKRWTTPAESAFLMSKIPNYISIRAEDRLRKFWPTMFEEWFKNFPEEPRMGIEGLTADGDAPDLPEEQAIAVKAALQKRKEQLETWIRWHSKKFSTVAAVQRNAEDSLANELFKKKAARRRAHRPVELFQKRNKALVDAALDAAGFFEINEAQMAAKVEDWENESEETQKARIKAAQAERMQMRQQVVDKLFSEASDDELRSIDELVAEEKKQFALIAKDTKKGRKALAMQEAEEAAREPTSEEYQLAIDESPEVVARVHKVLARKTGWYGITIYRGPNPRYGGGLSMKTICFGRTLAGNDFEAAHGTFDDSISKQFQAFLKRSFPGAVRRARAAQQLEETVDATLPALDGLFRLPDESEAPAPAAPIRTKPKRLRKSKQKANKQPVGPVTSSPPANSAAVAPTSTPLVNVAAPPLASPASSVGPDEDSSATTHGLFDDSLDTNSDLWMDDRPGAGTDREDDAMQTQWPAGMGPPSSPATAEANASAEHGGAHGATYMHATAPCSLPINPTLLDEPTRGPNTGPNVPRPAWRLTLTSIPTSPTPRSSRVPLASSTAAVPPNSPAHISRISTTAMGASKATGAAAPMIEATANTTATAAAEPSSPPLSPFRMRSRPMANIPGADKRKAVAAGTQAASKGRGTGRKKAVATEAAAKEAAKEDTATFDAQSNLGATPAATATPATAQAGSTLIYTMTNNSAPYAKAAHKAAAEKKARETAEKKERARLHNPDGPSDLVILPPPGPARAQRTRKVVRNFDGSEVAPLKRMTRAEQVAKKNQATENALLARTGRKRGAEEEIPTAKSRAAKKSYYTTGKRKYDESPLHKTDIAIAGSRREGSGKDGSTSWQNGACGRPSVVDQPEAGRLSGGGRAQQVAGGNKKRWAPKRRGMLHKGPQFERDSGKWSQVHCVMSGCNGIWGQPRSAPFAHRPTGAPMRAPAIGRAQREREPKREVPLK